MRVAMIGSGYVGLVSGSCFADFGHHVSCVDNDASKIEKLHRGIIPIFEPGLDELIDVNVAAGRLVFTTDLAEAVRNAEVVFIAVGTPSRRGDGHADLAYVYAAVRELAASLSDFTVVVTKSTVPVGTGDEIEHIIREVNPAADFAVMSNPEFLKEGAAIADFQEPDRIVIGGSDERGFAQMKRVYEPICRRGYPLLTMDRRGAELTKYAANALLATKITFINEIADLCEKVGTNVEHISRGIGLDTRIGARFLNAGPGYGGSCFPKDTLALMKTAHDFGAPQRIVESVVMVNENRKRAMGRRIVEAMETSRGKTAAVLGLTFKANTDDMRDSPSLAVIRALQDAGVKVQASDPQGMKHAGDMIEDVAFSEDPYDAVMDADVVVIATEWEEFRRLDLSKIKALMRGTLFVDLRNVFSPSELESAGFQHLGVGRPAQMRIAGQEEAPGGEGAHGSAGESASVKAVAELHVSYQGATNE